MADLQNEFETEPNYYESASLESVYARYGTIAGPALTDSFHFGQTWWNDFGRPLGRGSSAIAGYSVRAHSDGSSSMTGRSTSTTPAIQQSRRPSIN